MKANICRLCAETGKYLLNIFSDALKEGNTHGKIVKYLFLDVKEDDDGSKCLCLDCLKKIEEFHLFCEKVAENQKKLEKKSLREICVENDSNIKEVPSLNLLQTNFLLVIKPENRQIVKVKTLPNNCCNTSSITQNNPSTTINDSLLSYPNTADRIESSKEKEVEEDFNSNNDLEEQRNYTINHLENVDIIESGNEPFESQKLDDFEASQGSNFFCEKNNDREYPKTLIKNDKIALKGKELNKMLSKFYKLNCDLCLEKETIFSRISKLLAHYRNIHKVEGYVKCCDIQFYKLRLMSLHMARHLQPDAFKCRECGKILTSPRILRNHMQNHLPEKDRPLACSECPRRFSYSSALNAHKLSHLRLNSQFVCNECGKVFSYSNTLSQHCKIFHSNIQQKCICNKCGKQFTSKGNLAYHITTHEYHPVQCEICQKWLKNKLCLRKHMAQHSAVHHQCKHCDYSSLSRQCFRNHMRVQHTNDKPYKCEYCGRTFKLKNTLLEHTSQHTGVRKYFCEFCSRNFASSGNYYSHRKRMHPVELTELNQKKELELKQQREINGLST